MNRREIFAATITHQKPERILVDYGKHIGSFHAKVYERIKTHLGIQSNTKILDRMAQNVVFDEEVCQKLASKVSE